MKHLLRSSWIVMLGLAVVACDSGEPPEDTDTDTDTDGVEEEARLRVVHLLPGAGLVDILLDGDDDPAIEDLDFTEGTDYATLDAGTHAVAVVPADGALADAVLTYDVELDEDKDYTTVVWNTLDTPQQLLLLDDLTDLAAGQTRLQVSHVAGDFGNVDIWDISGSPMEIIPNLAPGQTQVLDVDPTQDLRLAVDVDDDSQPDFRFEIPDLPADALVNVFAANDEEGDLFLLAQLPDGETLAIEPEPDQIEAQLRLLHLSPDAPAVDVWIDGNLTADTSDLMFVEGTAYLPIDPGMHDIVVTAAGDPITNSVHDFQLDLMSGSLHSVTLYDQVSMLEDLDLLDDPTNIPSNMYRLTGVHAAVGVGPVDIYDLSTMPPTPIAEEVGFGSFQTALLPAAAAEIGIDVDDDGTSDLTFDIPAIPGGTYVNLYAVSDMGDVFLVLQREDSSLQTIEPAAD